MIAFSAGMVSTIGSLPPQAGPTLAMNPPSRRRRSTPTSSCWKRALLVLYIWGHGMMVMVVASVYRDPSMVTRDTSHQARTFYEAFGTKIYDPQGRLLQMEYALQATRKGGAAVGAVSSNFGVIASWRPMVSRRQAKSIDQPAWGVWGGRPEQGCSHVAMAATGVATDIMVLSQYIRNECDSHKFIFGSPIRLNRLLPMVAQEMYRIEQLSKFPAAVDMLVCGADDRGVSLYSLGPSGVFDSFQAYSIGAGSQAAKAVLSEDLPRLKAPGEHQLKQLLSTVMRALLKTMPSVQDRERGSNSKAMEEDVTVMVVVRELHRAVPVEVRQHGMEGEEEDGEAEDEGLPRKRTIELILPPELAAYCEKFTVHH